MHDRANRDARRTTRRRAAHELNIVSMIDVMIVLVFFLLLQTIGITSLGIDLPSTHAAPPAAAVEPLTIEIGTAALRVTLGSQPPHVFVRRAAGYDLSGLDALLTDIKRRDPARNDATVLAAPGIAYGDLVTVMDAVRGDGTGTPHPLFTHVALGDAPRANGGA